MDLKDVEKTFAKKEPHTLEKLKSGRVRLIISIAIIDQIIARCLWTRQHVVEIASWRNFPSKPGMGLAVDEDCRELFKYFSQIANGDLTSLANSDIKHWDFSVQLWEMCVALIITLVNMGSNPDSAHWRLSWKMLWNVTHPIFSLPNGKLYVFTRYGMMLSGFFETSRFNCVMRWAVARLIGASDAGVMGDDSIEGFVEDAIAKYRKYGHDVKLYERCQPDHFEFCSQLFYHDTSYPVDGSKTLFRALEQPKMDPGLLMQFVLEMRNHPKLDEWVALLMKYHPNFAE
jgi:hypothetical protein